LFLLIEPQARQIFKKKGLYIAGIIFLIIIAPHFIWLYQHDFVTLHYAQNRVDKGRLFTLWGYIKPTLRFAGNQLLDFVGAVVIFSFLLWGKVNNKNNLAAVPAETLRDGGYQGENRDSSPDCKQKPLVFAPHLKQEAIPAVSAGMADNLAPKVTVSQFDQRFLWSIAATPFVLTLLLALILGWQLYALWGTPLLSLWGILLLIYTQPAITKARFYRFLMAVIVVIAGIAAGYTISLKSPGQKATVNYPSREVAHAMANIWHQRYHEPLKYIAGDRYTTFYVAVYSKDKPSAYIDWDPIKSPWIDEQALRKTGAIFVQPVIDGKQFPAAILQRFPTLKILPVMYFKRQNVTADTPPVALLVAILPPDLTNDS